MRGELQCLLLDTPKPSSILENPDEPLKDLFREVYALKGRQQAIKWHPEGTAWNHTMLVVDRAAELSEHTRTVWGALVHDLGKAVTDSAPPKWQHINHEALGVPLVKTLGERLEVPEDWIIFGQLCAKYHLLIHRFEELRSIKRVDLMTAIHPWQDGITLAAQADAQGRGDRLKFSAYPQRQRVLDAHKIWFDTLGDLGYTSYHWTGHETFSHNPLIISPKDRQIIAREFIRYGFCRENEK